jgi:hypothetical protein
MFVWFGQFQSLFSSPPFAKSEERKERTTEDDVSHDDRFHVFKLFRAAPTWI